MIRHGERIRVVLKLVCEIRRRGLTRREAGRPSLSLPARDQVLAKHLHPFIVLKIFNVDGRVGWRCVLEAEPNGGGRASGTYPTYGGPITRSTTGEHDRFSRRRGTWGTGPRSRRDVRQRRGADILSAKTAQVRGATDRIRGSRCGAAA